MSQMGLDYAFTRTGITANERLLLAALCHKLPDHQRRYTVISSVAALATLLEMRVDTVKRSLRSLKEAGHLSWKAARNGSKKVQFTINIVNPYIEEAAIKRGDRELLFKVDLFEQIMHCYPVFEGRNEAWKAFVKLEPTDRMFFDIVDDLEKRLTGAKPAIGNMHLSTYFTRRLWEN